MKRLLFVALLLGGCAMTPEAARNAGVEDLCHAVIRGDRESSYNASQEIRYRGHDPSGCGAVFAARQQRALQMMGLGAGVLISAQPQNPTNCVTTPLGGGAATTTCR
jgi:hypothetical protein